MNLRPVGYVLGLLIVALGAAMLLPLALDLAAGNGHWPAFMESAIITLLAGGVLALACASDTGRGLTLQQSFLLTTGAWVTLPAFGALPFMIGAPGASFTHAVFESMSGMTTTGSTVFVGLQALPVGTNLWRGILQWLGGLGIIIVALLFLPVMKVGGMQFFRSEGFDTLGKILPRALDISAGLIQIYVVMTLACVIAYMILGLSGFDAVMHAMTTVSTGGFSNYDASFGVFPVAAQYASALFMILASLPFIRYLQLLQGSAAPIWRDVQVRAYLRWIGYAIALILVWRLFVTRDAPVAALHETMFNTVSIFSGTGYTSADVSAWGAFPLVVAIVAGFIGGCTSSTSCSVKVFRYLILFEAIRTQLRRLTSPNMILPVRYDGRTVGEDVVNSVILFFTMFVLTYGVLAVGLSMTGLSARAALTAAWTAIANVGPAYGREVGDTGAFDAFPDSAIWMMTIGMMLGRLELLSVYV
ncbi:MAG: TrkH family potassium uptake protein, partial [Gemmobacter sp.]